MKSTAQTLLLGLAIFLVYSFVEHKRDTNAERNYIEYISHKDNVCSLESQINIQAGIIRDLKEKVDSTSENCCKKFSDQENRKRKMSRIQFASTSKKYGPKIAYIDKYADIAIEEYQRYGIPPSIKLGQAIIESRHGTSTLAVKANNHFGIKWYKGNSLEKSYLSKNITGTYQVRDDCGENKCSFMSFTSDWASYRAHSLVLLKPRYKKLFTYGLDYERWAYGLKEANYATADNYAKLLIDVIEQYELYEYDYMM